MDNNKYKKLFVLSGETLEECPEEIKILPVGHVSSEKGEFEVDEESFKLMKAEMLRRGIDIVIDYEHQTLKDIQAPAAGWIKDISYTPEAIVAKVEWTPRAKEYLKNREYRYLSPVVLCRNADEKAVVLHSGALTNTPAINGMFAIANSIDDIEETINTDITGGNDVELKKLIELLGLPEDATKDQVLQRLAEAVKKADEKEKDPAEGEAKKEDLQVDTNKCNDGEKMVANSVILGLLGLPKNARTDDVTSKIMTLKAGSPDVMKQMQELALKMEEKDAGEAVMLALKSGKITADQKDWAKDYALKDREGFDLFVAKAPVVVPVGKIHLEDAPKKNAEEVSAMVLKATGMSKEDIAKYADKEDME